MPRSTTLIKALSAILPAGACGASILLALSAPEARAMSNSSQPNPSPATSQQSVSTRLQTIRTEVSSMTGSADFDPQGEANATPTWWGNGGWGRWHLGWGNGGWRNGGWGNGGWHNGGWGNGGWGNGWHNGGWGNGGWGNGWHNFWHNW